MPLSATRTSKSNKNTRLGGLLAFGFSIAVASVLPVANATAAASTTSSSSRETVGNSLVLTLPPKTSMTTATVTGLSSSSSFENTGGDNNNDNDDDPRLPSTPSSFEEFYSKHHNKYLDDTPPAEEQSPTNAKGLYHDNSLYPRYYPTANPEEGLEIENEYEFLWALVVFFGPLTMVGFCIACRCMAPSDSSKSNSSSTTKHGVSTQHPTLQQLHSQARDFPIFVRKDSFDDESSTTEEGTLDPSDKGGNNSPTQGMLEKDPFGSIAFENRDKGDGTTTTLSQVV